MITTMGKSIHVAKRYIVEFGNTAALDDRTEAFIGVLESLGCSVYKYGTEEDATAGGFETPECDYKDAIDNLKAFIKDPSIFEDRGSIKKTIADCGETPESLLAIMQNYLHEADTRNGYLHFLDF